MHLGAGGTVAIVVVLAAREGVVVLVVVVTVVVFAVIVGDGVLFMRRTVLGLGRLRSGGGQLFNFKRRISVGLGWLMAAWNRLHMNETGTRFFFKERSRCMHEM